MPQELETLFLRSHCRLPMTGAPNLRPQLPRFGGLALERPRSTDTLDATGWIDVIEMALGSNAWGVRANPARKPTLDHSALRQGFAR
jgi:hypothetical protein